ncbi:MAG TPA: hypothetical protein VHW00_14995 [Thermoanaerobaculia bacterium]|nr:hypothetical protein [Thermoanaerobaculia bacterium]
MRSFILAFLLAVTTASAAAAADNTDALLARAWPAATYAQLDDLGAGIGIVFTPDLSVKDNCDFYRALGFACWASPDWLEVLSDIHAFNSSNPGHRIRTLILETHGTNGNGLKLQSGKDASDPRSYIAVAALQEILEPVGVQNIIISACNSGRLLRPEIYRKLDRNNGDKLFLPATRGILDATDAFDEKRTRVTVITPGTSRIETTVVGSMKELTPATRTALTTAAKRHGVTLPKQFAISEMLIQMLLRSDDLVLRTGAHVEELSKVQTTPDFSEKLFRAFTRHLEQIAERSARTSGAAVAAR